MIETALLAAGSAFLAGLAGSGHCIAMCGGMAGLLSARKDAAGRPARKTLTYNAGRIASYVTGGLLAGGLGQAIGMAAGLNTSAGYLRVVSGVVIILAGLYLLTGRKIFAPLERLGEKAWKKISPLAVRQLNGHGNGSVFLLGMLWGWLPCGLTWSMLAVAASSASIVQGGLTMLAFGLGTLPALVMAGLAGLRLRGLLNRAPVRRVAALALILAGAWTAAFPIAMHHAAQAPAHESHAHYH